MGTTNLPPSLVENSKTNILIENTKVRKSGNFKNFKRTIKFRKYELKNSQIVRRKNIIRLRLLNNLKISTILRFWAVMYKDLRGIWRFYQNYGLFNLNVTSPQITAFYSAYKNKISYKHISGMGISNSLLKSVNNRYAVMSKSKLPFLKSKVQSSRNSFLTTYNSEETLDYFLENKFTAAALIKHEGDYYPLTLIKSTDLNSILDFRMFFTKLILKKILLYRKLLIVMSLLNS